MSEAIRLPSEAQSSATIVVPAFNEAEHLADNIGALIDYLDEHLVAFTWDIVIVDDGSTDGTGKVVASLANRHRQVSTVAHRDNLGLGQALKTGFRASTGDYIVTCDADFSYDPDHVVRLLETIRDTGAAIVVASPYMDGGTITGVPRMRAVLSRGANRILSFLSNSKISTVTGIVRAYDRRFLQGLSLKSVDNQINAEIIYKTEMMRQSIVEIPAHLHWTRDEEDTSQRRLHLSLIRTSIDFLFSGFIFRPFLFFVLPGFLLLLLAAYALFWAGFHVLDALPDQSGRVDYALADAVAQAFTQSPHSFVVGGIAGLFAVQLISLGVISAQSKRYFEDLYHLATSLYRRTASEEEHAER